MDAHTRGNVYSPLLVEDFSLIQTHIEHSTHRGILFYENEFGQL